MSLTVSFLMSLSASAPRFGSVRHRAVVDRVSRRVRVSGWTRLVSVTVYGRDLFTFSFWPPFGLLFGRGPFRSRRWAAPQITTFPSPEHKIPIVKPSFYRGLKNHPIFAERVPWPQNSIFLMYLRVSQHAFSRVFKGSFRSFQGYFSFSFLNNNNNNKFTNFWSEALFSVNNEGRKVRFFEGISANSILFQGILKTIFPFLRMFSPFLKSNFNQFLNWLLQRSIIFGINNKGESVDFSRVFPSFQGFFKDDTYLRLFPGFKEFKRVAWHPVLRIKIEHTAGSNTKSFSRKKNSLLHDNVDVSRD